MYVSFVYVREARLKQIEKNKSKNKISFDLKKMLLSNVATYFFFYCMTHAKRI